MNTLQVVLMHPTAFRRARLNQTIDVTDLDGTAHRCSAGECEVVDLGATVRLYEPRHHEKAMAEVPAQALSAMLAHRQLVFLSWR